MGLNAGSPRAQPAWPSCSNVPIATGKGVTKGFCMGMRGIHERTARRKVPAGPMTQISFRPAQAAFRCTSSKRVLRPVD